MRKYVFRKMFKYEDYPKISQCMDEANRLLDLTYDVEADYEEGKCSREDWHNAIETAKKYRMEVLAKVVFNEFCDKNLILMDSVTKKKKSFEELFGTKFEEMTISQKNDLLSIFNIYGWLLPAEYYDKKHSIEKY